MQKQPEQKPQAHGLSVQQMQELHEKQKYGETQPKVNANKDSKYQINENEQHLVHVLLRVPGMDERTEMPMHKPFVQSFYPDVFNNMDKNQAFKTYIARIIHDPRTTASIAEDLANDNKDLPVSRMNKEQLEKRYCEVYNVEAVPVELDTNEKIREEILTRIQFLADEAAAEAKAKDGKGGTK